MKRSKLMHTTIMILMAAVLVISAGCGSNNSPASPSDTGNNASSGQNGSGDNQDTAKKNVLVDFYTGRAPWADNIDKVGEFLRDQNGVGFKTVATAGTTAYQTVIKQSLQGDNPPPLFDWWSGFRMEDIVKSGTVADLTDEWKNHYEQAGLNADLATAFTVDGKVYGVPMNVSYWNVFYNKQLFAEYDLTVPTTWDEFTSVMDTLKDNGIAPLGLSFQGWTNFIWFGELLAHSDPDLYADLMVGKAKYTDPGVVEVMELYKSMIDNGYFSRPGKVDGDLLQDFVQGKIAMHLVGDWFNTNLLQAEMKPDEDYGSFILPVVKPGVQPSAIFETSPILVSEKSRHKEDALEALRGFFQQDAQKLWTESQGFAPFTPGIPSSNPVTEQLNEAIESGEYRLLQRYWEATPPEISEFAVEELGRFILEPEKYMEVLNTIEAHAQQYWASQQ